ncbi:MAG: hypothetical protein OXC62_07440 [Aestuariivita sp.]|nr:hypothetical protein [Aestuariivita sp.]
MNVKMNAGLGRCQGTARLLVKPVQPVIALGASPDVLTKVLNAVHHTNRHSSLDDFIAVALPEMDMGRDRMLPGHEIELIGTENVLSQFQRLEGMLTLQRRSMLQPLKIEETFYDVGEIGAAYVRDRIFEKRTPGWLQRSKMRAERRGKPWKENAREVKAEKMFVLKLNYGNVVLFIREIRLELKDVPLFVSTYGFSSARTGHQAVLPVWPKGGKKIYDEE